MTDSFRPLVAIVATTADAQMLSEWTSAAGFDSVRIVDGHSYDSDRICGTLVRWPIDVSVQDLPGPVILMHERGVKLQTVVGAVADIVVLPDSSDASSMLAWSARLSALLWSVAREHREASRHAAQGTASLPPRSPESVGLSAMSRVTRLSVDEDSPRLIAIGISTGGPVSLRVFFAGLQNVRSLPPIVIVQHIPPAYVAELAQRLCDQTGYDVRLADDHVRLQPGVAYIAPGHTHLRVRGRGDHLYFSWDDGPSIRGHCPAVEVLFDSCAGLDGHGVAVMMTGMGRDGAMAMLQLRERGWATLGQNKATCTIYGMPCAAKEVGAIERELALEQIAPWLVAYCRRARHPV